MSNLQSFPSLFCEFLFAKWVWGEPSHEKFKEKEKKDNESDIWQSN